MRILPTLALLGWLTGLLATPAPAALAGGSPEPRPVIVPTVALPGGGVGLRAQVAGRTGLFLFDTGGGVTIVTPATAAVSGCRPWGRMTGFRATGERLDTLRCDNLHLTLGGRAFTAPIASVFDLQRLMGPDMPELAGLVALDLFAGRAVTIRPLAHQLVLETAASLRRRTRGAREVPIRPVRDVEGVALTVDGAVQTAEGRAWMELDTGNLGPLMVGEHVAPLLGLDANRSDGQPADFALVGGVPIRGPARVSRLIMDGDIGQSVLRDWDVTLDLASNRAWLRPASADPGPPG